MKQYYDAHFHPQLEPVAGGWDRISSEMRSVGWAGGVANGIAPADWPDVKRMSEGCPALLAAYGLHPWKVLEASGDWAQQLEVFLQQSAVCVGEIGLDRWIQGYDLPAQEAAFEIQWSLALQYKLPATVHCLRAWGRLLELLQQWPVLPRGFLLHAYGGPVEMISPFVELGAYFSFSAYIAHPKNKRMREAARNVPSDRLLIETDAPDMLPPEEHCVFSLQDGDGNEACHPGSIAEAYRVLAQVRGSNLTQLTNTVADNYASLFH